MCVEESLTSKHRLLFWKKALRPNHLVIITKEPERQTERLNVEDFKAMLIGMRSLEDSFCYFNSGVNAGQQQNHKHFSLL
jgi:ATP adenylyltransferase